jgi:hypothetical protein
MTSADDIGELATIEPTADLAEKAKVADAIRTHHKRALDAKSQVEGGLTAYRTETWLLAVKYKSGKDVVCGGSTKKFHKWLKDNGLGTDVISANDRAALLGIAANPSIAKPILEKTTRMSWQLIWREEVQPEVERLCSHTNSHKKNGRPKGGGKTEDAPPPRSPLDEMLAQNLVKIAKRLLAWSRHTKRGDLIAAARQCFDELCALLDEYDGGLDAGPAMAWGTAADVGPDDPF